MCLQELSLADLDKIVDVALSTSGTRLAVLTDLRISLYSIDMSKRPVPPPALLWSSSAFRSVLPRHVAFISDEQISILADDWLHEESSVWISAGDNVVLRGPILEPERASSLVPSVDGQKLYVHFQDGSLHEIASDEEQNSSHLQTTLVHKFPSFAPEIKVTIVNGKVGDLY